MSEQEKKNQLLKKSVEIIQGKLSKQVGYKAKVKPKPKINKAIKKVVNAIEHIVICMLVCMLWRIFRMIGFYKIE